MSKLETESGSGMKPKPLTALPGGSHPKADSDPTPAPWSLARVGLYMTEDHRYYWNGTGPYPSVTTILKVLDKPAVTQWIARQTALAAMTHIPELIGKPVEEGISFLMKVPRDRTDSAARLGSYVHLLADMAPRADESGPKPFDVAPEAFPYLEAFRGFLDRYSASNIISSEKAVLNLTDGYAGTYDLLMVIDSELWLIDIKTSKGYYPEYGLQLAAYRNAEYIALPDDPTLYPMPEVIRTGILHLRPDKYADGESSWKDGWRLIEYPTAGRDYVAFLAALDLYQWKAEGRFTKSKLQESPL